MDEVLCALRQVDFMPSGVWAAYRYRCCLYPYGSQARLRLKLEARGRGPGAKLPPQTPYKPLPPLGIVMLERGVPRVLLAWLAAPRNRRVPTFSG